MICGFANSMFQSSKVGDCGESNWSNAIINNKVTQSHVKISHWENYIDDINIMKNKFNATSYRISVEWSHIEPTQSKYDYVILTKYKELVMHCINLGIKPMLTLHQFNEPLWFSQMGGFEDENNIKYFIDFSKIVYKELNMVDLWCTINEPAIYAFMGYLLGGFPPFAHNLQRTIIVLKNLLRAHTNVYAVLKDIDKTKQIGIVHNVLIFKQLYTIDPISYYMTKFFNRITNELVIEYFSTGVFSYDLSILGVGIIVEHLDDRAKYSNDFIGLNFYANPIIGPNSTNYYGATYYTGQEMGDMYLPLDPEGFGNAIDLIGSLKKPIYVTEMGIADKTDLLRQKFVVQYSNVMSDKIKNGVDIKGHYYWTFRDNYEWNQKDKLFGFHDIDGVEKDSCKLFQ